MVQTLLRSSRWIYALIAASMGAAGCFTSPINRAPLVTDVSADGVPLHGQPAMISAHGYDPDDDQLTWTWAMIPYQGGCPDKSNPANWPLDMATPSPSPSPTSYQVPASATSSSWCVWAFAKDPYGAVGADCYGLVPSNNPPHPVLRVVSPDAADSYPAYTHFEIAADQSTDADSDQLLYTLTLDQSPLGSTAMLVPCGAPAVAADPRFRCLDVPMSGQYVVSLTVSDGIASPSTSMTLKVLPDQPPCITMTTPDFRTAVLHDDHNAPKPIIVNMVTDDGDPFPNPDDALQTVTFTWFKGKNGGPLHYVDGQSFSKLDLIPMDYSVADSANVRLEVHDRNTAAIDAILLGCGDQPFCPVAPGSTCFVRVSWHIKMDQ